ncbi:SseB family protein [Streptomyces sp. NPDC005017]|uniref:SseB family protein n=1 Tax=Streptomyces sp. NPDC005017 TaxID=3364706 RepID=UPI0036AF6CA0
MDTPAHRNNDTPAQPANDTPAGRALDALVQNTDDTLALATLADSDVLVPVPDDATDAEAGDPGTVTLPVIEQPGAAPVVPVFTSEPEMAGLLPYVSRYRVVPLGALASQWPEEEGLSLTIDAASDHGLTLTSEGVRTLLARPRG